ncbi:MAG: hypothetical protein GF353_13050 [Candidatus Lokiarchaeota archaeon]|nr:hypothetical protein [Candidatus Lokiarchaeota archaeon]
MCGRWLSPAMVSFDEEAGLSLTSRVIKKLRSDPLHIAGLLICSIYIISEMKYSKLFHGKH